jgi:hypothetical protein
MIVAMSRTIIILLGLALCALLVFARWGDGDRCGPQGSIIERLNCR